MRRRDFIRMAGGAAVTWPFAARAQQRERLPRVAVLEPIAKDTPSAQARYTAFLQAFEQLGWMDGRNVQIVARWSGGNNVELHKYAEELVALAPDVILAGGGTGAEALLKATRTIPIVFAIVPDPVGAGIVERLSRPGGNATGFAMFEYNLCGKWLELFREIAPSVKQAAVLFAIPDLLTGSANSPSFKPWRRRLALKSAQSICTSQIRLNAPSRASHSRQMAD